MKKLYKYISAPLFVGMVLLASCREKQDGILIWNDPPTSADTMYQNPVFEPDLADPSVVRAVDGTFYAYGTENNWSTGIHRVVPIITSKNLVDWQYVTDAFATRPTWKTEGGIWAPDVTFVNSKYYMYYSMSTWGDSNPGIGLAIADLPYGPFVDQGKVFDSKSIGVANSIDACFIQTGTGRNKKSYLIWGSFEGIYGTELSADLKTPTGTKFKIAGGAFEGVMILERDNKFYFFASSGSCCDGANSQYHVSVARADAIKGPYLDKAGNAIMDPGKEGTLLISGNTDLGWVGPGHNAEIITDDRGTDFFVYHAIDVKNPFLPGGATRRALMVDRMNWVDGWPTIEGGKPSNTLQAMPQFNK